MCREDNKHVDWTAVIWWHLSMTVVVEQASAARRLRILIVDDHAEATEALAVLFSVIGHDTRTARTAREAQDLVGLYMPDVLLLDIGLPDVDGYELARTLRANGAALYIIAVTGWCSAEDKERAFAAGCDLHISKPIDVDRVCGAIRSVCKKLPRRSMRPRHRQN